MRWLLGISLFDRFFTSTRGVIDTRTSPSSSSSSPSSSFSPGSRWPPAAGGACADMGRWSPFSPAARGWLQLAVQVVLALALAVALALLATRHNQRFDLTPTKAFALSASARQVAAAFNEPVRVTAFYSSQGSDSRRDMADVLEQFAVAAPDFSYRLLDLDRSPALAAKYNVSSYNTGVLEAGADVVRLRAVDEGEVTAALLSLSRTRARTVCFLTGHGERSPEDTDERAGYSAVAKALSRERFGVQTLTTIAREGVPPTCTVVVLAGPSKDFLPGERDALLAYLRGGGRVLLLIDPDAPPSVVAFLRAAGIEARPDLIVDQENRFVGADAFMPQVLRFRAETFHNNLTSPAVLSLARPVGPLEDHPEGVTVTAIAATSPDSWAMVGAKTPPDGEPRFDRDKDQPGPLSVGALATFAPAAPDGAPGLLMAFGDSDFAANFYLDLLGNRDLILSAVAVLAEDPALVAVRRKSQPAGTLSPISLTAAESRAVFWGGVVAMPALALLIGGAVGLRRLRRRGGR
ncbi:MAG: GldG family protein [Candidatus Binatia bacterium]